jgi:glycosyltransferase involved in cell wall biosynthesis
VLACTHDSYEIIVADQSDPVVPVAPNDRVRHLATDTRGKSAALNVGVAAARGEIIAFTDDDCTVPPDWLDRVEDVFTAHPEVALAFGQLCPAPHDPSLVFVPPFLVDDFEIVRGQRPDPLRAGAGGDMAARRSVFDAICGYDERIGPGSRFRACEELDLYYRVLAVGQAVAFTPDVTTTHWGARSYADGSGQTLKRWYAYGEGAVIGKHLRMRDRRMAAVIARVTAEDFRSLGTNLRLRRLTGLGQLVYRWRGIATAMVSPVDRRRQLFV